MKRALVGCAEHYDFRELTSLQYSRGHIMPSAMPGRDVHAIHSIHWWWKPENLLQNRPHSTSTQESSIGDASASAILHGPKPPSQSHRQSNFIPMAQDSNQARRRRKDPVALKDKAYGRRDSVALKDKAYGRRDSVALKDDAYIRSTMHVPTQEDYPSIKASVFKTPNDAISAHVQNGFLAKELKVSKSGVFQSIISCNSLGIEAVEGEGTRKVLRSDSSEFVR